MAKLKAQIDGDTNKLTDELKKETKDRIAAEDKVISCCSVFLFLADYSLKLSILFYRDLFDN